MEYIINIFHKSMKKVLDSGFFRIHISLVFLGIINLIFKNIFDVGFFQYAKNTYFELITVFIYPFMVITWLMLVLLFITIIVGKFFSDRYLHVSRGLNRRKLDNVLGLSIILSGLFIYSYYSILIFQSSLEDYNEVMYRITKDVKYIYYSDERPLPKNIIKWLMR